MLSASTHVVVTGAGPAGLTASYLLAKRGVPSILLEADPRQVGGLSRTVEYRGYRFDIGGHRFFTKAPEVAGLWEEWLPPEDFLRRPRVSRIFHQGKFYSYPLKAVEALSKLGPLEAMLCALSYGKARLFPVESPASFEDWVSNRFGRRLYRTFFRSYTEKVWGTSCRELSADWAAQRIRGLSLALAIRHALGRSQGPAERTLIDSFHYPRLGPGMMWEAAARKIREAGGQLRLGCRVTGHRRAGSGWVTRYRDAHGSEGEIRSAHVISSAPLRDILRGLDPEPRARSLADRLRYRDFILVALILEERQPIPDNWIYVHDAGVRVGRIQNFKSWSPDLVPEPGRCCYGLEYFCFEQDELWRASDGDLKDLAAAELEKLGLARAGDVVDGCVVRQRKAYPIYDEGYREVLGRIRTELEERFPGLHVVGRNGMHRYNNQDHAMLTAIRTVSAIAGGGDPGEDPWNVNDEADYHESASPSNA